MKKVFISNLNQRRHRIFLRQPTNRKVDNGFDEMNLKQPELIIEPGTCLMEAWVPDDWENTFPINQMIEQKQIRVSNVQSKKEERTAAKILEANAAEQAAANVPKTVFDESQPVTTKVVGPDDNTAVLSTNVDKGAGVITPSIKK